MRLKMTSRLGEKEERVESQTNKEMRFIKNINEGRDHKWCAVWNDVPAYLSRDKRMHECLASAHSLAGIFHKKSSHEIQRHRG